MKGFKMPVEKFTKTADFRYNNSGSVEWWTPPEVFSQLNLDFDLDPCAPAGGVPWIPTRRYFSIDEGNDGLFLSWSGRVWLNPPYGGQTTLWLKKLMHHGNGIALVNAHTEAKWFAEIALAADLISFVRGRIWFVRPDWSRPGPASANSIFCAYGKVCAKALLNSSLGNCVVRVLS
jgi:hypothetical protein